jgi:hypothetical protein
MLPGFSSKNNYMIGGKKLKQKKYFNYENDQNCEINEILLQYNLEKIDEHVYDFQHCNMHRDTYPFASSLSKEINFDSLFDNVDIVEPYDSDEQNNDQDQTIEVNICTYQINTSCEYPFIEYLMIFSNKKNGKNAFEFPKFDHNVSSKRKNIEKQAEDYISKLITSFKHNSNNNSDNRNVHDDDDGDLIKFRGIFKDTSYSKKHITKPVVYLFFQKFFKHLKHPPQLSKHNHTWWVVASEIVNFKKVMYMDIDPAVTELFVKNPEIMQLYDCNGRVLETPTICYFGDEFQKIKYLAFFGLLKAPVKSSFGPFYVATNFLSSMKYACYTHNQEPFELYSGEKITSGEYGKYKEGGVLRMVLFIGKMKVFLRDGPPDESQISQELAKTDKTIEKFLSLRDSNGNWTEEYDTAYKGLHFASMNGDVAVNPVEWFFKDYSHFIVVSYHNIDTVNIPEKFDVDYTNYKLK